MNAVAVNNTVRCMISAWTQEKSYSLLVEVPRRLYDSREVAIVSDLSVAQARNQIVGIFVAALNDRAVVAKKRFVWRDLQITEIVEEPTAKQCYCLATCYNCSTGYHGMCGNSLCYGTKIK